MEKYHDYLQSAKWKEKRERIAKQRNYTCEICERVVTRGYNIHHKTYKHLGKERDSELMFLCAKCHEELHISLRAKENNLKKAKEEQKTCNNCYYSQEMLYKGKKQRSVLWCNKKSCASDGSVCSFYRRGGETVVYDRSKFTKKNKKEKKTRWY